MFDSCAPERYRGAWWELGNEPNLGYDDPEAFAVEANVAANEIKDVDGDAVVVSAGILRRLESSAGFMSDIEWIQRFGNAGGWDGDVYTAAGFHPYCSNPSVSPRYEEDPATNGWKRLEAYAEEVPVLVMVTEQGFSTEQISEDVQGRYTAEVLVVANDILLFGPLFIYSMRDVGGGYEGQFGLLREDGHRKPAWGVVDAAAAAAPDARQATLSSLDARLTKMQSVGATILSNASYARKELGTLGPLTEEL